MKTIAALLTILAVYLSATLLGPIFLLVTLTITSYLLYTHYFRTHSWSGGALVGLGLGLEVFATQKPGLATLFVLALHLLSLLIPQGLRLISPFAQFATYCLTTFLLAGIMLIPPQSLFASLPTIIALYAVVVISAYSAYTARTSKQYQPL